MAAITIIGGTGYAGGAIAKEAAARGHDVTVVSRTAPAEQLPGVTHRAVDVLDADGLAAALSGAAAVVSALAPRGELTGRMVEVGLGLATAAAAQGAPLVVIGGFGSLRAAEGAPRILEGDDFPEAYRPESQEMLDVLEALRATGADVDWLYISPAATFGAFNPGVARGTFRLGGEVALFGEGGTSDISGADFARAVVDVLESGTHHREHLSVVG
jgi:putative NADH-flavin reductase